MTVSEKLMSAEELLALPEDNLRYELMKGELITISPAGFRHGEIASKLDRVLGIFVEDNNLGTVVIAEAGFRLETDPDTVRVPDVAFVAQERLSEGDRPDGFWSGPPDLAVEVVSPNDSADEVQTKVTEYLAADTRLVWVLHPKTCTVTVYQSLDEVRVLTEDGTLEGGELLPGFSVAVRDLFS